MVNISPIASGRLDSTARTLFGSLLKKTERGESLVFAAPLPIFSESDSGGGEESNREISFLILFLLVRVLGLLSWGARSWDLNWGFGALVRVFEGFKGEGFEKWNARESMMRKMRDLEREIEELGVSSGNTKKEGTLCSSCFLDKVEVKLLLFFGENGEDNFKLKPHFFYNKIIIKI